MNTKFKHFKNLLTAKSSAKKAFTLAEVLITMGIVGVVAALTLPTVINNYKKKVVVTKMKKFYTTMNQAVKLATIENGDNIYWNVDNKSINLVPDATLDWYNKYLAKYFNDADVEKINDGIVVKLNDGSGFGIYNPCASNVCPHVIYYVDNNPFKKWLIANNNKIYAKPLDGKNTFLFVIKNNRLNTYFVLEDNYDTIKSRDYMIHSATGTYGCDDRYRFYCSALIENDGWEIKDDYPW